MSFHHGTSFIFSLDFKALVKFGPRNNALGHQPRARVTQLHDLQPTKQKHCSTCLPLEQVTNHRSLNPSILAHVRLYPNLWLMRACIRTSQPGPRPSNQSCASSVCIIIGIHTHIIATYYKKKHCCCLIKRHKGVEKKTYFFVKLGCQITGS